MMACDDGKAGPFRTGQYLCYDAAGREIPCAGTGQDGEGRRGRPWPRPRFGKPVNGVVPDLMTGLFWTQDANPQGLPLTWDEARARLEELNDGGYLGRHDWRLPGRTELRSLLSHQETRPPLPAGHPFRHVFSGWYWTGTTVAEHERYAWYVHMGGGRTFYGAKESSYLLWPVAGRAVPGRAPGKPLFLPEGGAVRDLRSGCIWQRQAGIPAGAVTWEEALRAVDDLNAQGGELVWRLPNIVELESLVNLARFDPALPDGHPFLDPADAYWSATSSTFEPDWAWALYLCKGAIGVGQKRQARFDVWPLGTRPRTIPSLS